MGGDVEQNSSPAVRQHYDLPSVLSTACKIGTVAKREDVNGREGFCRRGAILGGEREGLLVFIKRSMLRFGVEHENKEGHYQQDILPFIFVMPHISPIAWSLAILGLGSIISDALLRELSL